MKHEVEPVSVCAAQDGRLFELDWRQYQRHAPGFTQHQPPASTDHDPGASDSTLSWLLIGGDSAIPASDWSILH